MASHCVTPTHPSCLTRSPARQFKYIHVDLGDDKPAWFKEHVDPRFGTVPCVYDHGRGVFESAIVVEYLEEKFAGRGTALMPQGALRVLTAACVWLSVRCSIASRKRACVRACKDAALRAAVRLFVSQLSFAPMYAFLLDQDRAKDSEHIAACRDALVGIEAHYTAASPTGPFFLGEALSAADIALLPFLDRLCPGLAAHRGWHMLDDADAPPLPRICSAFRAVQARRAWRATAQSPAFYVSAYEGYAAGRRGVPRRVRAQSPDASAYAAVKPGLPLPAACRKEA